MIEVTKIACMVVVSIAALAWFYILNRCRHAWELVVDRELPSRARELSETGFNVNLMFSDQAIPISKRAYVAVVRCSKCGALRVFREESA